MGYQDDSCILVAWDGQPHIIILNELSNTHLEKTLNNSISINEQTLKFFNKNAIEWNNLITDSYVTFRLGNFIKFNHDMDYWVFNHLCDVIYSSMHLDNRWELDSYS